MWYEVSTVGVCYTDSMKYTSFIFPFVCGILFVFIMAISSFFVFAEEIVSAQVVSQSSSLIDAVVVFFKTFGFGFGATFSVMWLIVRLVKGDLVDRMEKMENNLKESINTLVRRFERLESHFVKVGQSPVQLTKMGQELLRNSGGLDYLAANKDALLQEFSDMDDPFVIQEHATKVIREKVENNEVPVNTKWMYKRGRTNDELVDAIGIELHDMVFRSKSVSVDEG